MNNFHSFKKAFLYSFIAAMILCAVEAIWFFLFGKFNDSDVKILFTTFAIGGYSLTGLCSAALYEKRKLFLLFLPGILLTIVGYFLSAEIIWGGDSSIQAALISIILSISYAHVSLLLLIKSKNNIVRASLVATVVAISIVALMLIHLVVIFNSTLFYFRLLGVFAILDLLGTVVTPILYKLNPSRTTK